MHDEREQIKRLISVAGSLAGRKELKVNRYTLERDFRGDTTETANFELGRGESVTITVYGKGQNSQGMPHATATEEQF